MKNLIAILIILSLSYSCSLKSGQSDATEEEDILYFTKNENSIGPWITVEFQKGESFYYPLMAIWLEDLEGNYIQTLFVPESVATSVYRFGEVKDGKWEAGVRRWPQTLPYWAHKRNIKASDGLFMPDPDNPVPDAYSGATPITGFVMSARADEPVEKPVNVMLELNQNWDWNEYWTNDKYPGDEYYLRSCQPAVVYKATINPAFPDREVVMKAIGHSHPSGSTGELFSDLSTLTTALTIADSINVYIGKVK
ncbi:MAG: hypothetical protein RQ743_03000 [Bacteroidales bacterium]|nr:hypothetical protein [Bacteroidales bacterium]